VSSSTPPSPRKVVVPVFFSIVSANYLAYAITLMRTVGEHYPGARRYVVLADEDPGDLSLDQELFTLVPVRDLGLPHPDHFAMRYSVLEFNTAVKPFALRWLAQRHGSDAIVYLDPDIYLLSPIDAVTDLLADGALAVVTPHLTAPAADDKRPDELTIMRVGVYNLGFIALGRHEARRDLIDWWAGKLEHGATIDLESGLFTDQKWVDLIPGLFPDVRILRDPGYNLAYWNLAQRPVIEGPDGRLTAGGRPLAFVHFSGVDVRHPEVFSVHQERFDADGIGDLRPLYRRYLDLLLANGYDQFSKRPYAWSRLHDGTVITTEMRAIFRNRFDIGRPDETSRPFDLSHQNLEESVPLMGRLNRRALRSYPRLRAWRPVRWAMRLMGPGARAALLRYMTHRSTPPSVLAAHDRARVASMAYPTTRPSGLEWGAGANVIGYLKGEFGVAEAARSLIRAAATTDIELALINIDAAETARAEDLRMADRIGDTAPHPVNILCVNADQTELVMAVLGPRITDHHYNVGVWFWELGKFPDAWQGSIASVDEIWTASHFVEQSVAGATTKPVRTVRLAVDARPSRDYSRSEFGLPEDRFLFLFSFDFASYVSRKNPVATIDAFRTAFPKGDEHVGLVLKSTNGSRDPESLRQLEAAINGDGRIRVLDRFLSRDEVFGLESVVDSYVSLHRSEGFGLGLAESMSLGKPVIGTAYSGNMEFMDGRNSCLVGYRLVDVRDGEYPYADGQLWADPDIDSAAYFMRRLVNDQEFAIAIGRRAAEHMAREFSARAAGVRLAADLERIAGSRRGAEA
jgi:glycosyltransferase involved in cell wall biosynthesis